MDLNLFSYSAVAEQGKVDNNGTITLDLGGPITGQIWLLDHLTVQCNSLTIPFVTVYVAASARLIDPGSVIDYTDSGNNDVSEYPQPQLIPETQHLIVVWRGVSALGVTLIDGSTPAATGYARATFRSETEVYP